MCLYKKEIFAHYFNHSLYVNCGKCPACLQEKANKRARRICANIDNRNEKYDRLICNLTYDNDFVPYIKENELIDFLTSDVYDHRITLPVYRDKQIYHFYNRHKLRYEDRVTRSNKPIQLLSYQDLDMDKEAYQHCIDVYYDYLRKKGDRFNSVEYGKIGVCLFKDVQDFLKRIRQYLKNHNYDFKISYYACTEYGETTTRPHIHILLQVPRGYYSVAKSAVIENWKFSRIHWDSRNVELAIKPAAYIASYVNSSDIVKGVLAEAKCFKVKHSYSQGYGCVKDEFTFTQVLKAFERRDLTFIESVRRDGVNTLYRVLYPKYVISRYFPKFKGYSQLSSDEMRSVIQNPDAIYGFTERLCLTFSECESIKTMLYNKLAAYCHDEVTRQRYEDAYISIWSLWYSNLLKSLHDNSDPLEMYDNIVQFYSGEISSAFVSLDGRSHYEEDPNKFLFNLQRDDYLRSQYQKNNKKRKANDYLYNM